jgi:fatty acid desaturase
MKVNNMIKLLSKGQQTSAQYSSFIYYAIFCLGLNLVMMYGGIYVLSKSMLVCCSLLLVREDVYLHTPCVHETHSLNDYLNDILAQLYLAILVNQGPATNCF